MEIKQLFNQNPNAVSLILKNKNFKNSSEVFKELESFKELIELDLQGNNLADLPEDLSNFHSLKSLDLTNNPFTNFEKTCLCLATIPNLLDLKINLSSQNEALLILNSLPKLVYLNEKLTKEDSIVIDIDDAEVENFSLNSEISNFNTLFTKISDMLKSISKEKQKIFFEDFQVLLKTEIDKINKNVDLSIPNYYYAANVIHIFNYFNECYFEYMEEKEKDSTIILSEIYQNLKNSYEFLFDIIMKLSPKIDEKSENFKTQLENAYKSSLLNNNNNEGDNFKTILLEKESLIKQYDEDKQFLQEKIERLERENKLITDKLLKSAKNLTTNESINKSISKPNNLSTDNNYQYLDTNQSRKINSSTIISPTSSKIITKKSIKDIICEIYDSKAKYDKKNLDYKLPKETMEQHMYSFLNNKYGLKNLVIEWAACIVSGVKMFAAEDSEICLFGKILRNEIEEESRSVIQKLKATIPDILTLYFRSKFPLKANDIISDIVKQKTESYLIEEEWKAVIYHIYESEDANYIEAKIHEFLKKKSIEINKFNEANKKLTRDEVISLSRVKDDCKIMYSDFQNALLDFQIKTRCRYLKNFSTLFKKCDSNNDGVLNEVEFNLLMTHLETIVENISDNKERYLSILDPFNHGSVIFTDTLMLFSKEILNEVDEFGKKKKISLLDKICTNEKLLESLNSSF